MDDAGESTQKLKTNIDNVIDKYIQERGFTKSSTSYNTAARNFCSVAKRILIKAFKDGREVSEHLFVKTLTNSKVRNERLKLSSKFERESFVYNNVLRHFEGMQSNIPEQHKLNFIKCIQATNDFIILEDVMNNGYKDVSRSKTLDLNHVEMMIKNLAKFHALSFALKYDNREKFEELIKDFKDIFVAPHRVRIVNENCWRFAVDAVEGENRSRLIRNGKSKFDEALKQSSIPIFGVICHGDYNLRNVLFKYDEDNDPSNMFVIDFQLSHFSSPIRDINFLVSSSLSTELRDKKYTYLLDVYYESLSNFLVLLNCDVNQCYPKEAFIKDFDAHFPCSFANSLVVLRVLCSPEKTDEEIDKIYNDPEGGGSILVYDSGEAERDYSERVNGLIKHYISLNYI